jgi:hypothetical protein
MTSGEWLVPGSGAPPSPSEYVVFVDESGDHSLTSIDQEYPVFVLAFCVFKHDAYTSLCREMAGLKLRHFGHDAVVLHEREIRKATGAFRILHVPAIRSAFMSDLTAIVQQTPFAIVAIAIRKLDLVKRYSSPDSPYDLGVAFGLERVYKYLEVEGQGRRLTHFVFEARGKKEDTELELEFRRVCDGANAIGSRLPFDIHFAVKSSPTCGLQLADLVARPIGRHVLAPAQDNRAYSELAQKFRRGPIGQIEGYGLKMFP